MNPLEPSAEILSLYIAFMVQSFKYVSIVNYVSAVRGFHKWHGKIPVPPDNFLVSSTLIGARRLLGDSCFSSDPLLPKQLIMIYHTLDMSVQFDVVFWAATVVAFRGLLCKSAVCKGDGCILRKDVEFHDWGVVLILRKSKTIQFKDRVHKIPLARVAGPLCAVTWIQKVLSLGQVSDTSPLFGYFKKNCFVPLDYVAYAKRLNKCLSVSGLRSQGRYTSHSLRRGGATMLSMLGVPLHEIQRKGDWKSLSLLLYLASPFQYRVAKERVLAQAMVQV